MEKNIDLLVQRYKEGKLSLQEELFLAEKLGNSKNPETAKIIRKKFDESMESVTIEKDLSNTLSKVHHTIRLRENNSNRTVRLLNFVSRIAAVLFLPLLLIASYLWLQKSPDYNQSAMIELVAPAGSRLNFELPDGTTGTLAGNSTLSYHSAFTSNRSTKLTGQAYFDVAHDSKHPFRIAANENTVEVVGTKFSLSAFPNDNLTDLILEEGKVIYKSALKKDKFVVSPGDRILDNNGNIRKSTVSTWKYTAWKEGKLVLRKDSMKELAQRLSRWYNVDVEINSPDLNEYSFRGVFDSESLEEVLTLLKMTTQINYQIIERKENPDGSFTRKKVIFLK